MREGNPAAGILAAAREEKADLIVLAGRGREAGEGGALGGTDEAVVRGARCPVPVVRK